MKYLLALLIIVGGILALSGVVLLMLWIQDSLTELQRNLRCKHGKYDKFCKHIVPWISRILMSVIFVIGLIVWYIVILNLL